jgi:septum formation topological specificity factor MinE
MEEFKKDILDYFLKYVKITHNRGITFDLSEVTDKLLEKYEVKKRENSDVSI